MDDKNLNKIVVEDNIELAQGYQKIMSYPPNYYLMSYSLSSN